MDEKHRGVEQHIVEDGELGQAAAAAGNKATEIIGLTEESLNLEDLEQDARRAQDKIDALSLNLVPMDEIWRACQWIMSGADPAGLADDLDIGNISKSPTLLISPKEEDGECNLEETQSAVAAEEGTTEEAAVGTSKIEK